jgi:N utilization substance protein A
VQAVVAELAGEKIDVIPWSDDASIFVANALSPAQVISVDIDEEHRIASVTVPERMLSLAIGREGQNARLAARLTGWRIDIRSDVSVAEAKAAAADAVTAGPSSQIVAPVAEQAHAEAEPVAAPAPKPKRASKKTVAEQAPAEAEPVAEPAPKSKRATKKTVDIAPTEEVAS